MNPDTQAPKKVTRWKIVVANVVALALAIPLAYISLIMAAFASDSGPNTVAYIVYYSASALVPLVIGTIVFAQITRRKLWIFLGLVLPFVPLALLFGIAALRSLLHI